MGIEPEAPACPANYDGGMASKARIGFWVGVAIALFVLLMVVAITFSGHGSEYGGGGGY